MTLELDDETALFFEEHGARKKEPEAAAPAEPAAPAAPEAPIAPEAPVDTAAPAMPTAPADLGAPYGLALTKYNGSVAGTWLCTEYVYDGVAYDAQNMFETPCTLDFALAGGEAFLDMTDYTESIGWSQDGDTVSLTGSYVFGETAMIWDGRLYVEFTTLTLVFDPLAQ